jgi:hypothetical protein
VPLTVFTIVQSTFMLLLVALWIQERRSQRQETTQLTQRLICLESSLGRFMRECEEIFAEMSGKPKTESTTANQASACTPGETLNNPVQLVIQDKPNTRASVAAPPKIKPLQASRSVETTNQNLILRLATQGVSAPEIASRLSVPQGEVELILNLRKITLTTRKGKTA